VYVLQDRLGVHESIRNRGAPVRTGPEACVFAELGRQLARRQISLEQFHAKSMANSNSYNEEETVLEAYGREMLTRYKAASDAERRDIFAASLLMRWARMVCGSLAQ
jgi:hypothetical protein